MTVGELKEILEKMPDDATVFTSSDPEGNGIWRTHDVMEGYYDDGDFYDPDWPETDEMLARTPVGFAERAVVIWP